MFSQLHLTGLRIALIFDVPYHEKTLYYLHRSGFYTIGPVPINYDKNLVDFPVPAGVDSVFTQMFFIRFILQMKSVAVREEYNNAKVLSTDLLADA